MAVIARITEDKKVVFDMDIKDAFHLSALIKAARSGEALNEYGDGIVSQFDIVLDNTIDDF